MADRPVTRLERVLRVRTLQLGQVRADETRAAAQLEQEELLRTRIAQLSASVAPAPAPTPGLATSMIAAAHYRDRLNQSAVVAEARLETASRAHDAARKATREAKRDQSAIEKLIEHAEAEAARRAMRALEDLPSSPRKRHDPC